MDSEKKETKKTAEEIKDEVNKADDNRLLDDILCKEFNIKGFKFEIVDLLFVIALWILAYLTRSKLFPIVSGDYTSYNQWMEQIYENGVFSVIGAYSNCHLYLLGIVVSLADDWLAGIKVLSIIFEYAASIAGFMIVYHMTGSTRKSILGMTFLLLSPAMVLNGSYFCQCDAIYSCFILWGIYFILKGKGNIAMIMMGFAFSFKLQAVFILPFLIIIWLKRYVIKLVHFIWIPIVYIVTSIPLLFNGYGVADMFGAYSGQTSEFPWGTLEYPNIYALMDENMTAGHFMYEVSDAGLFLSIIVLGIICYYIYVKKVELSEKCILLIAILTVAVTIYTLPHMHDRYGFLIDVIIAIYVVIKPKRIPLFIGFSLITLLTYMPYMTKVHIFSIQTVALAETVLIGLVAYELYKELVQSPALKPV